MNKDQVKGTAKQLIGKVQEKAGEPVGSGSQQYKGLKKQVEGGAARAIGNVKAAVKDLKSLLIMGNFYPAVIL